MCLKYVSFIFKKVYIPWTEMYVSHRKTCLLYTILRVFTAVPCQQKPKHTMLTESRDIRLKLISVSKTKAFLFLDGR